MAPNDSIKDLIEHGFTGIHHRLDTLEKHVTGGSEPTRSLVVKVRDLRTDVDELKTVHRRARNFFIGAGIASFVSVGAAIKAGLSLLTNKGN